ncbi:hypothetical protein B0H19DRAFT_1267416 [Mycena capillaripes]|nr:hypothetical protein B0H19DRAFT_1267416 [Mycena capillaripes]
MTLASFPEELLEQILADTVIAPAAPHPRAAWHLSSSSSASNAVKQTRGRIAPSLVCRVFHRITLPLFYHTLVLHSSSQSLSLLATLRARPALARAVRTLVLPAPCASDAEILRLLPGLRTLDITLPANSDPDSDALAASIRSLRTLRVLAVRKSAATYLCQPAPRALLDALADAVNASSELTSMTLSFPLSSNPALARLATALSAAPALRTLRTPLPALWAPAYVTVAGNPMLENICLGDEPVSSASSHSSSGQTRVPPRPLLRTGLFLSAARPHARLVELIKAGTVVAVGGWRGRAATVGSADAFLRASGGDSGMQVGVKADGAC